MKNILFYVFICLTAVALLSGCAPKLAQTKYGPEETQWKNYISNSYREWQPPATPPPLSEGGDSASVAKTSIEIVPEPANMSQPQEMPKIESVDEINIDNSPMLSSSNEQANVQTYTVQKGDTLWTISKKFYNNGGEWRKVQDANKDQLPTPQNLKAGMTLKIPGAAK